MPSSDMSDCTSALIDLACAITIPKYPSHSCVWQGRGLHRTCQRSPCSATVLSVPVVHSHGVGVVIEVHTGLSLP
jgi:hypothetical protein